MDNASLSELMSFELCVSEHGKAVVLYKNKLPNNYIWVQYDKQSSSLQLVSKEGDVQDMGIKIPDPVLENLLKAQEMHFLELSESNQLKAIRCIALNEVLN